MPGRLEALTEPTEYALTIHMKSGKSVTINEDKDGNAERMYHLLTSGWNLREHGVYILHNSVEYAEYKPTK